MLLTLLGSAFSSILAGGATGLAGAAIQRLFDLLNAKVNLAQQKQQFEHELQMKQVDLQIMDKEYAGKLKIAEQEGATASDVAASQAFAQSLFKEPERYAQGDAPKNLWGYLGWFMMILLDFLRGIVRPGLTLYLAWITTQVYHEAQAVLAAHGATMTASEALQLVSTIIGTILYLFTTCVLWYFGTRNKQQPPKLR